MHSLELQCIVPCISLATYALYRDPLAKKVSQPEVDRICIYMSFLLPSKLLLLPSLTFLRRAKKEKETFLAFSDDEGRKNEDDFFRCQVSLL